MSEACFFAGSGIPLVAATDVIPLLAKAHHWRQGRSAYETAHSWFDARGIPASIRRLLATDPAFAKAELVRATFEKQTPLDAFGRPSQTDVLALLRTPSGPAILSVEAKVDETFGPTIAEWGTESSAGKQQRLAGLLERVGLSADSASDLRYQLLHRIAAALIEAKNAGAVDAAMVVQSFSPPSIRAGFGDFQAFARALGLKIDEPGALSTPIERSGIRLRLGWAQDQTKAEHAPG